MEKSREINGWKAKNFKIKTEAGKHSRSNLLTTYDKVLRLQCILCSEGMYPASWELTIHRRMKKSRVVYCKKNFFWGGALSRGLFRTFACGSFRSWTIQSTPSKLPHKNPNYIRDTSAPFLDRWLNCASLVCHCLFWIGLFSFAVACLKPIYRRHALARAAQETGAMHPLFWIGGSTALRLFATGGTRSDSRPGVGSDRSDRSDRSDST